MRKRAADGEASQGTESPALYDFRISIGTKSNPRRTECNVLLKKPVLKAIDSK